MAAAMRFIPVRIVGPTFSNLRLSMSFSLSQLIIRKLFLEYSVIEEDGINFIAADR